MSSMDPANYGTTSDKAKLQKSLSPNGLADNGPATSLLLGHRSMADMLLRRASSAGHSWRNINIHSYVNRLSGNWQILALICGGGFLGKKLNFGGVKLRGIEIGGFVRVS